MWDILVKFLEYLPLYVALVLVPAIIRTFIDTALIKIPPSAFLLPPSDNKRMSVKYEDAFASIVGSALYAPLIEELVFRAVPYLLLGMAGLIVGNIVWILAHPSWQLRYISGLTTKQKLAFTANTVFYYGCASAFFTIPWLEGYGLLAIAYHMLHNGMIVISGIFNEIEVPAPWKKEEGTFFRESRGVKKKLEERFFKDTNPPDEPIEVPEIDVDINGGGKFFKEIKEKITVNTAKKEPPKPMKTTAQKATAMVDENLWGFWVR